MCCRFRAWIVLLLLGLTSFAVEPAGEDWPLFHGNPQQTGFRQTKLPAKLEILWTFKTADAIENAVAVAGKKVFVASMDEHLYAVDLNSGKQLWKYKGAPFKSAPAYKNGAVYVGDLDGFFHCVDAAKGTKKWVFEAGGEIGGANFHREDVLFACHDENLYCLSKDGKKRWKFKTEGPIYGAPAVADGKTFLVGCDSQLHVIDVDKGKELSSTDLGSQTGASAAVVGDHLFVGTMGNVVKQIDWKKAAEGWTYKAGRNAQIFSSPAVTSKFVVVGARDNRVHCIDRKTGNGVWTYPTGNRVDSSPVVADTQIIVGSLDGKLYVLDLNTGKELAKFTLDAPISASPVLADGKVIIGTQKGTLYCLGAKK